MVYYTISEVSGVPISSSDLHFADVRRHTFDRTDTPGYYVAIGTSGSSFKTAPVIGAVMAQLIRSCEGGHDHDAAPLSVTLPKTGFEVDLGFFSRRRGAHTSTGTVLG